MMRLPYSRRARLLIAGGVFAGALLVFVPVMDHVALNGTPSIKPHLLWKTPKSPIAKGDYVLAPARHPYIPQDYTYLAKIVLCMPGDRLAFRNDAFWCDGARLAAVKAKTRTGAPLTPFVWDDAVVPDGFVFIGSYHPDGFDSRYLGLFRLKDLTRLEAVL